MATKIDKQLCVTILGDASQMKAVYADIKNDAADFSKTVDKNGLSLQNVGTIMAAVGATLVTSMAAVTIAVANSAREIEHNSEVAGVTAEQYQGLAAAADMVDVSHDAVTNSLDKLSKSMVTATTGTGKQAEVFRDLGVNVQNADGSMRSNVDVLGDLADKFKNTTNETTKLNDAQVLFGKSGAQLIPLLDLGRDGIQKYADQAQALGGILSDQAITQLSDLSRNVQLVTQGTTNWGKSIAADLAPYLNALAQGIISVEEWLHSIPEPIQQVVIGGIALGGVLGLITGAAILMAPAVWAAVAPLAPFIALGALLAGTAIAIYNNWNVVAAFFMTVWDKVSEVTIIALNGIKLYYEGWILAFLEGLEKVTSFIPGWGAKLKSAISAVETDMHNSTQTIQDNAHQLSENHYNDHLKTMVDNHNRSANDHKQITQKSADDQLAIQDKAADELQQKRDAFIAEWKAKEQDAAAASTQNLQDEIQHKLNAINDEEQKTLAEATKLGVNKTAIEQYYVNQRIKIINDGANKIAAFEQQNNQKLEQEQINHLQKIANNEKLDYNTRFSAQQQADQLKIQDIQKEEQEELQKADELGADKTAIEQLYAQKIQDVYEESEEQQKTVYNQMASNLVDYANQVESGNESITDVIKDYVTKQLTALEEEVIADALMGISVATSMAPGTFGASLAWIPGIKSNWIESLAVIEGAKALVRGLAEGGITNGPSINLIGEGDNDEAVLPLTTDVFTKLAQGIVTQLKNPQNSSNLTNIDNQQNQQTVILNVGTLIGDKHSLQVLQRKLQNLGFKENNRLGIPNPNNGNQ